MARFSPARRTHQCVAVTFGTPPCNAWKGAHTVPKGYVIFTEEVRDSAALDQYAAKAMPTLAETGGRPLIVDDNADTLEGQWPGRTVVLEFDSVEAARAWYQSPEYQAIAGLRHAAADTNAVIVAGFDPGS